MGHYTIHRDSRLDDIIQKHLDFICQIILKEIPYVEAIILIGGFGRGEGSVLISGDNIRPVNDYDIIIVSNKYPIKKLKYLSDYLAKSIGIDFVDLSIITHQGLKKLPLTMQNYDTKYGSRVLFGENGIMQEIPEYNSRDMPMWEGIKLLFNRMAGILGGLDSNLYPHKFTYREKCYMTNQNMKALMACGDAFIISKKRYNHLYSKKKTIFISLAAGMFDPEWTTTIECAFDFKLAPDYELIKDFDGFFYKTLKILKHFYLLVMNVYLRDKYQPLDNLDCLDATARTYLEYKNLDITGILRNIRNYIRSRKETPSKLALRDILRFKDLIYISLPYLAFAISKEGFKEDYCSKAANLFGFENSSDDWFYLKDTIFHLWEMNCH